MIGLRGVVSIALVVMIATFVGVWLAAESRAQERALAGSWTLNHDASDHPPDDRGERERGDRGGSNGGYGRRGGRGGGGGFGGGFGRRGVDREEMRRMREAMRDIMTPPEHLAIAQTDTMILITAPDRRATRLSPDGSMVKDENTKIERKTRWDGVKLVSEISGIGPARMTETYAVDHEHHQLRVSLSIEGRRPRTMTSVYDADSW